MKSWTETGKKVIAILSMVCMLGGNLVGFAEEQPLTNDAPEVIVEQIEETPEIIEEIPEETVAPTEAPTAEPEPTEVPTAAPEEQPTEAPTEVPVEEATGAPATEQPTAEPEPTAEAYDFSPGYVRVAPGAISVYEDATRESPVIAALEQGNILYAASYQDGFTQVYYSVAGSLNSGWVLVQDVQSMTVAEIQEAQAMWNESTNASYNGFALPSTVPELVLGEGSVADLLLAPEDEIPQKIDVVINGDAETFYTHNYIGDGLNLQLNATVYPATASQSVIWTISDSSIATIYDDGRIKSKKVAGTVTVIATTRDISQVRGICEITFTAQPSDIGFSPDVMTAGQTIKIEATALPEGSKFDETPKFSIVSGKDSAQMDAYGYLKANSDITVPTVVTVRARYSGDNDLIVDHEVLVRPKAKSVSIRDNATNAVVSSFSLDHTLDTNKTKKLKAIVSASDAQQKVTWKSSNTKVAKVSAGGTVTAVGPGTATITATAADGSAKKKTATVTVKSFVRTLTISGTKSFFNGTKKTFKATATPKGATDVSVTWSSSNKAAATVDSKGVVTGKAVTAKTAVTITAKAKDGSGVKATYTLNVYPATKSIALYNGTKKVTSKTIDLSSTTKTYQLDAKTSPASAYQGFTWKSGNTKIAKVSSKGLITAVAPGTTTITATAKDGTNKQASFKVTVKYLPTKVKISGANGVSSGAKETLKATISPSKSANKDVTWSSSNTAAATVSSSGVVTAKKVTTPTTVTITATAKGKTSVKANYVMTVYPAASSIKISYEGASFTKKTVAIDALPSYKMALGIQANPVDAQGAVTWKSSDTKVATVSSAGVVTPKKAGKVTITATTKDSKKATAKATITFTALVDVITISGGTTVTGGATKTLKATIAPSAATNKAVTWKSDNKAVATVNSSGVVTTKVVSGLEIVTITATAKDGSGVKATYNLKVYPKAKSVSVIQDSTGVKPSKFYMSSTTSKNFQFSATVSPADARQTVKWSSDNTAVAKISSTGKMTAVRVGWATITATASDGSGAKVSFAVEVRQSSEKVKITGVKTMKGGATQTLKATFTPTDTSVPIVTWSSSDTSVATVNSNSGVVTAKAVTTESTVVISAKPKDGGAATAKYTITVTPIAKSIVLQAGGATVTEGSLNLSGTKTVTLTPVVTPAGASQAVTWSSSNTAIAKVSSGGKVTAVGNGTATITATTKDGTNKKATYKVTVHTLVSRVDVYMPDKEEPIMLVSGLATTLGLVITPATAIDKSVTWSSSNTDLATVSTSGVVTPKAVSDLEFVTIYAKANDDSGLMTGITLSIRPATSSIKIYRSNGTTQLTSTVGLTLSKSATHQLQLKFSPANTHEKVKWTSSNTSVVTVSENGLLTAKKVVGTSTITVTTQDGTNKKASFTLTVK